MKITKTINRFVVYLLFILFFCPSFSFAQTPVSNLKPLAKVLEREIQFAKAQQMARSRVDKKPLNNTKILENLGYEKIVGRYKRKLELQRPKAYKPASALAEHNLMIKYQNELIDLFKELDKLKFFLSQSYEVPDAPHNGVPVRFVEKEGKTCLLITGVTSEAVYDTSKTTPGTRAARMLTDHVSPILYAIDRAFKDTVMAYYGVVISYNCKDYSVHTLFPEEEALGVVVSRSDLRELKAGKMTRAAFLASSELFLSDKEMKEGFRKVE